MKEQAIVEVVEAPIEAAAKTIVETVEVVKNDPLIIAGAALIGLSTGALIGYRLAKKYLEPKYAALAEEEIQQARILYAHRSKDGMDSPSVAVQKLIPDEYPDAQQALAKYQGKDVHLTVVEDGLIVSARKDQDVEVIVEPKTTNIFDVDEPAVPRHDGWDYDTEIARRTDNKPFVVTQEEYFENEHNLECISVTWYEGDEILADSSDGIISDLGSTVGEENLKRFGHGSGEDHIVYIFNKKAGMGFEVSRHEGKYSVHALGLDDDEPTERMPRRGRRLSDD